jgi:low affinity Fe/Cu permease
MAFATQVAKRTGSQWAMVIAAVLVLMSLVLVGVETTNLLVSIVTLLMVFVLQNTQNRDSAAIHLKLDEIVTVEPAARDDIRGTELKSEHEIEDLSLNDSLDDRAQREGASSS